MLTDSTDGHLKLAINTHVSLHLAYCSIFFFKLIQQGALYTDVIQKAGTLSFVCMAIL